MSMIHEQLPKVMADLRKIEKGQENEHFEFKFRGIDDALNAVHPVLVKHGVSLTVAVDECEAREVRTAKGGVATWARVRMSLTFYALDGSCVTNTLYGEALDYHDKAIPKAQAIAMKYLFFFGLCIPVDSEAIDDPDADAPPDKEMPTPAAAPPQTPQYTDKQVMDSATLRDDFIEKYGRAEHMEGFRAIGAGVKAVGDKLTFQDVELIRKAAEKRRGELNENN